MELSLHTAGSGGTVRALFWRDASSAPEFAGPIQRLVDSGRFCPDKDQVKALDCGDTLLLIMGTPEAEDVRHLKGLLGRAVRMACEEKAAELEIDLDTYRGFADIAVLVRQAAQAAWEGSYRFDAYRSQRDAGLQRVCLKAAGAGEPAVQRAFAVGDCLGRAVTAARDVVNRTSRDLTPQALTDWILARAEGGPYEVEVLDAAALREAGARALLSVSAAAENAPRMVVLRYRGDADHPDQVTALLGKGVTYDSGGLSLKSKTGMLTMHHDMGGAAAAAAAFDAAARTGLRLNVTAVLPICENMLSPAGYRPGDVISTMDGKTVLIKSTDAEGRLILADAMTWALQREHAGQVIDIATLTGGAVSAYGPLINAIAVTDDGLRTAVQAASGDSGELVWEMPLLDDYLRYLKTDHADIANSSNGAGSAMINAALFLRSFTKSHPWLHIDSAGTSWTDKTAGCFAYGATGAGTVLLYDLLRRLADASGTIERNGMEDYT